MACSHCNSPWHVAASCPLPPDPMLARIRELEAELDAAVRLADALATQLQASAHADRDALWAIGDRERALSVLNGAEGHFTSVEEAAFIAVHDRESLRAALVASEEKRRVAEGEREHFETCHVAGHTCLRVTHEKLAASRRASKRWKALAKRVISGRRLIERVSIRLAEQVGALCGEKTGNVSDAVDIVRACANERDDLRARATAAEALAAGMRAWIEPALRLLGQAKRTDDGLAVPADERRELIDRGHRLLGYPLPASEE